MPHATPNAVRFTLGTDGVNFSATIPSRASEVDLTLEEFKAISHWDGLKRIAGAIEALSSSIDGLSDALERQGERSGE